MFDAISINGTDLPSDVVELLGKITEVQQTPVTFELSTKELGTISQAVGGMKRALTHHIRSAPNDDAVASMVEMIGELSGLEQRIEKRVHQSFVEALGSEYAASDVAQKLNSLIDAQMAQAQSQAPGNSAVDNLAGANAYL